MPNPPADTLGRLLHWSYANLAMAHAAVNQDVTKYNRVHFMIRAKLYKGLNTGSMQMGSLMDDERLKMVLPNACAYCGMAEKLTLDHMISSHSGGIESADNAVWVCRSCNSSKGAKDFFIWWGNRNAAFPPLLLVRRYLKLCHKLAEERGLLECSVDKLTNIPFDPVSIPVKFPAPNLCCLWVVEL
jgi:hypothetical protein